jgi:ADP-ribosylglycohydrolase
VAEAATADGEDDLMLGAIAGDIVGSVFEAQTIKTTDFELFSEYSSFTDDTVLTTATAFAIMSDGDYGAAYKMFGRMFPLAGYGLNFGEWLANESSQPYNSWGNGSAMRVSPVGFAFDTVEDVLREAKQSAECTHNHPEGVKGAQAVALAVFLANHGADREEIRQEIGTRFAYDLNRTVEQIRPEYAFDISCQGSVPEAIIAFLDADNFEQSLRLAVSLGGDSDTQACIAGGIAHAWYGELPEDLVDEVRRRLPRDLLQIVDEFCAKYGVTTCE